MRLDPGIVFLAAVVAPVLSPPRVQDSAASRPAESRPASSPANATILPTETLEQKLTTIDRRVRALRSLSDRMELGESASIELLASEAGVAPADAADRTRRTRDELAEREEAWIVARAERERIFAEATKQEIIKTVVGPPIPNGPLPHPLATPNDMGLGIVMFRRGEFAKAAKAFGRVTGARARFFEARAFDAADLVSEALDAYDTAAGQAINEPELLASIHRSRSGLQWKTTLGKPEDLSAPLRPSTGLAGDVNHVTTPAQPASTQKAAKGGH